MKKRILLVDDHAPTSDVIQRELNVLGYEVVVAKNAAEAVELASSENPNLIVMDVLMPKMSGLEAVAIIRDNPKTRAIPILAATVLSQQADKERCLAAGCDAYIAKPFTYKELGAALDKLWLAKPGTST